MTSRTEKHSQNTLRNSNIQKRCSRFYEIICNLVLTQNLTGNIHEEIHKFGPVHNTVLITENEVSQILFSSIFRKAYKLSQNDKHQVYAKIKQSKTWYINMLFIFGMSCHQLRFKEIILSLPLNIIFIEDKIKFYMAPVSELLATSVSAEVLSSSTIL